MIQLKEPVIDNKNVYDVITKGKTFKNVHCQACVLPQSNCEECGYGNRGKMIQLRAKVFPRYEFYFQNRENLNAIVPANLLNNDESNLLEDTYKNSKEFQKVKNALLENIPIARRGLCPFCMISEPTTMEHYFSESDYPEYILFAPNLVPCCSYCNSKKGNRLFIAKGDSRRRLILHFYYDKIPQNQYLRAKFKVENRVPQISFFLEFKEESEITEIIKNHFKTLNLIKRYEIRCNEIVSTACNEIKECLNNGVSIAQCIRLLKIKSDSIKKVNGENYWQACIYEAIGENKEELEKLM